jgi:hypothetical protein
MANQINKRRGGFYWVNDKPYLSVTNILRIIDKPAIQYWFGQQVYFATIKDPSIDERTALNAPYATSGSAKDRGTVIHSIIEAHKHGADRITPPPDLKGYTNAFYSWFDDIQPKVLDNEKTIINQEYGYAGTLDMLAEINGVPHVIDFKTSKKGIIYNEAHIQVSAYINCEEVRDGLIVALAEDGTYTQAKARDGFEAFKHALELYKFINEDKLRSVGYDF